MQATKTRTKATQTVPATTVPAPTTNVVYTLNQAATALATAVTPGNTLQAPQKGLGLAWRAAGYKAPNTRAAALAAVMAAHNGPFTLDQAQATLQAAKTAGLNLGSGTPRSYAVAFVKNGYFVQVAQ